MLLGSDTAICGISAEGKAESQRSHIGVTARLLFLNTEAQRHGEDIFKFSEDTENLKNPWLCGFYILHFQFVKGGLTYSKDPTTMRGNKNPAGRGPCGTRRGYRA